MIIGASILSTVGGFLNAACAAGVYHIGLSSVTGTTTKLATALLNKKK